MNYVTLTPNRTPNGTTNKTPSGTTRRLKGSSLSTFAVLALFSLCPIHETQAVSDGGSELNSSTTSKGPNSPESIKAQERKLEEVIAGTIMRSGVVYPKHKPLPQLELNREFLRQGRPATTPAEIAELVRGLESGDADALANLEKNMASYLSKSNGSRASQIVNALNNVIDNPNKYKLNQGYAQTLLDKAFDKFITMNHDSKADLNFSRTNLDGKFIAGLDLRKTGLGKDQLYEFTDWANTNVSGLNLSEVDFTAKNTQGTIFKGANLTDSTWTNKDMTNNNLWGANLTDAKLQGANLNNNTTARRANMTGANLTGATARGGLFDLANFTNADLTDVDFTDSLLRGTNFGGANLTGTNFTNANRGSLPACNS